MDVETLVKYAFSFLGTPYAWGGDDPISGFDCSGFACELLRASGHVPWNYRANAQGLHDYLLKESNVAANAAGRGAFVFYGKPTLINHVGFALSERVMIEAGGGTSETVNLSSATARNAFVRLRPIRYRKDFLVALLPAYPPVML